MKKGKWKMKSKLNSTTYHLQPTTNRGFTLIELIMVMAILAVMATIFTTTYPASQRKARDANRKSDLKQYQLALETYANKNNGTYPSSGGSTVSAATTLCNSYLSFGSGDCAPDAKDGQNECSGLTCRYFYVTPNCGGGGTACATSYVLWGAIENPKDTTKKYFVVCSNGKTAEGVAPSGASCPI